MIPNDRKVAKAVLLLTKKDYSAAVYHSGHDSILKLDVIGSGDSVSLSLPPEEIAMSIRRLARSGYLVINNKSPFGDAYFRITDKLTHRLAFALDTFGKRFVAGYIAGFATALAGWLIQWLLSAVK